VGWKACEKAQLATNRPRCPRKTQGGLEKGLANLWRGKRITKKAHAGHGQETKWEIPDKDFMKTIPIPIQICLLGAALLLPDVVQAQFHISTNSNNTITINWYVDGGVASTVIIPAMTNGYPVTTIAAGAFTSSSMTNVFVPYTVTNIGNTFGGLQLNAININAQNPLWSSVDGVWFNKDQTTLIQFPEAKFGYTIPNSVTNIGSFAFEQCNHLTNVIIPNSVSCIGSNAFHICNITNITIPSSVTSIGNSAFYQCYHLASINIPASVTSIGSGVFRDCHGLTSATLPNNMTSLPGSMFYVCISLTNLTIPSSVTNIGSFALAQCSSLNAVYFQGNAPSTGELFYYSGSTPIIYYLPGTTNWGATLGPFPGSRPTMLWNPQAQTSDSSFGVRTNQFGFNITGTTNIPLVVEACTNLGSAWVPLQSLSLTNGSFYFSDSQWMNFPGRLYRIRSP
jgi:hypothetical protein